MRRRIAKAYQASLFVLRELKVETCWKQNKRAECQNDHFLGQTHPFQNCIDVMS